MKCVQRPRVFSLNNNAISGQAIWLKRIIGADISRIQLELVSVPFAISPARTLVQLRVRKKPSHPRPLISLLSVILQEIDPSQRVAKIRPSNFRLALLENRLDRRNWEKVSSNASTISIPYSACFHFTFTAAKIRPCSNRHRVNHFLISIYRFFSSRILHGLFRGRLRDLSAIIYRRHEFRTAGGRNNGVEIGHVGPRHANCVFSRWIAAKFGRKPFTNRIEWCIFFPAYKWILSKRILENISQGGRESQFWEE